MVKFVSERSEAKSLRPLLEKVLHNRYLKGIPRYKGDDFLVLSTVNSWWELTQYIARLRMDRDSLVAIRGRSPGGKAHART